jgi:hypothetical protein
LIILIIIGEEYKLWSPHYVVFSNLLLSSLISSLWNHLRITN